jgi:tetratricopeptide (TPR) repeat protein
MGTASSSPRRSFLAAALIAFTLVAYAPVAVNGFIWDDDDYVTENTRLRSVPGLRQIWFDYEATPQYYPMVHSTFWVEYQLWGLAPAGYHIVNVLLHALAAVLVWRILLLLGVPGAWFAAALFALHPVHVESVAWITERKNVLSGVFALGSLLAYLKADGFDGSIPDENRATRHYALALMAFGCALLSKTVTGSLPAVILLLLWWKRGRVGGKDFGLLAPFFLLAAGLGALTVQLETQHVGAVGEAWDLSIAERCLVAGRALWFYAGKLAWPDPLIFNYPRWNIDAGDPLAYLAPLAAVAVIALLWSARRVWGRGPLVAVLIFAGSLFPALGFFDVYPMRYSFVADHFQYLASLGLIVLFAAGATRAATRLVPDRGAPVVVVAALVLVLLGVRTFEQTRVYRDQATLWRDTLNKNPSSWLAHDALGVLAEREGRVDDAIGHFRQSIEIEPRQHEGYNKLGNALRIRGDLDGAVAALRRSLATEPLSISAHNHLGLALHDRGELDAAVNSFEQALAIHPEFAAAHTNLGITRFAQGHLEDAERHHREALRIDPDLAPAHTNLAAVLLAQGDFDEAIAHLERVVELLPASESARRNLRAARGQRRRNESPGS